MPTGDASGKHATEQGARLSVACRRAFRVWTEVFFVRVARWRFPGLQQQIIHLTTVRTQLRDPTPSEGLTYAGSAFIALSGIERNELSARLQPSKLERCPIPKLRFPDAQWVKPQLTARVRHLAGAKYLRHGTVRGFA